MYLKQNMSMFYFTTLYFTLLARPRANYRHEYFIIFFLSSKLTIPKNILNILFLSKDKYIDTLILFIYITNDLAYITNTILGWLLDRIANKSATVTVNIMCILKTYLKKTKTNQHSRLLAGSGHGELPRGGAARGQAGPVPAGAARVVRAVAAVRGVRQVVRVHRQGQPAQRLADAVRC